MEGKLASQQTGVPVYDLFFQALSKAFPGLSIS